MKQIRNSLIILLLALCCSATTVSAGVSIGIGIGLPNLSIGINLPLYPELVPVPGYPVYYAPQVEANYFFYDGMYWVYQDDNWYTSYWYNGPWSLVEPAYVPLFILRIPVRYYSYPPAYFSGWRLDAPPRWGQHWGRDWARQHKGWSKWNRGSAPPRAPLPAYQRQYTGERYPRQVEHQMDLRREQYRYQPRDKAVQQHFRQQEQQRAIAPPRQQQQNEQHMRGPVPQEVQRPAPQQYPRPQAPVYQEPRREQRQNQRYEQQPRPQDQEQRYQQQEMQQPSRGWGNEQRGNEGRRRERDN